ncbi:hypothetical protein FHT32_002767 [Variovorax sp. SG517]|uniref:DUF4276 family protein n=1 Tax=Variovorax sp. SG517 TaxID=2587117 RepID=UPI00159DA8BF|nr:DUF4276 family protein [Variovorax sp. SG517]NVM89112.1 hypothetical protein [Variovorax sp. SG517]
MKTLTATLVADGTSDRTLLPIIQFLLDEWSPVPHRTLFAEGLHIGSLTTRLPRALQLYPCDLLFIHRDAEAAPAKDRQQEIAAATAQLANPPTHVCLIPIRMTESWLLLDQQAIRTAAGNPKGTTPLDLPPIKSIERLADPKARLFEALNAATDCTGRRKRQFKPEAARHRVAELMSLPTLRQLPSFENSETQVKQFFETYE